MMSLNSEIEAKEQIKPVLEEKVNKAVLSRCQFCGKENPSREHIKEEVMKQLTGIKTDLEYLMEDIREGDRELTGQLINEIVNMDSISAKIYGRPEGI